MILNADRDQRLVMLPDDRSWANRPEGETSVLERVPDVMETLFLRLLPGQVFPLSGAMSSDREVLVLTGSILIAGRTWESGGYLRLSRELGHPFLKALDEGALLFIKAGPFPEGDRESIGVDTASRDWSPGLVEGLSVQPLFSGGTANTALVRWAPGTVFQPHRHFGGEEILVLSGIFEDEYGAYPPESWYRAPHLSRHHPFSPTGCTIFVKTGHLLPETDWKEN